MNQETFVKTQVARRIAESPTLQQEMAANPANTISKLLDDANREYKPENDRELYLIAISVLSALALIAAVGAILLVIFKLPIPEVLVALGSAAAGALVGLFAKSPVEK